MKASFGVHLIESNKRNQVVAMITSNKATDASAFHRSVADIRKDFPILSRKVH